MLNSHFLVEFSNHILLILVESIPTKKGDLYPILSVKQSNFRFSLPIVTISSFEISKSL